MLNHQGPSKKILSLLADFRSGGGAEGEMAILKDPYGASRAAQSPVQRVSGEGNIRRRALPLLRNPEMNLESVL